MKRSGVEVSRVVLDASAYSHLRAGHPGVLDFVAKAETVYLPVIVLGELEAAFGLGRRARENQVTLQDFLGEPFVQVLPVTRDVARRYGRLFVELRNAGTPVPVNDLWIAATTLDAGAHLLTLDTDFERIPHLDKTTLRA